MRTEVNQITRLCFRFLDFLQFFLDIELFIFHFKLVVPEVREVDLVKADIKQEVEVEGFQLLEVPITTKRIAPNEILFSFLFGLWRGSPRG